MSGVPRRRRTIIKLEEEDEDENNGHLADDQEEEVVIKQDRKRSRSIPLPPPPPPLKEQKPSFTFYDSSEDESDDNKEEDEEPIINTNLSGRSDPRAFEPKSTSSSQRATRGRSKTTYENVMKRTQSLSSSSAVACVDDNDDNLSMEEKLAKDTLIASRTITQANTSITSPHFPFHGLDIASFLSRERKSKEHNESLLSRSDVRPPNAFGYAPTTSCPSTSSSSSSSTSSSKPSRNRGFRSTSSSSSSPSSSSSSSSLSRRLTPEELSIRTAALCGPLTGAPIEISMLPLEEVFNYIGEATSKIAETMGYKEAPADTNRKVEPCTRSHAKLMMVQAHGNRRPCLLGEKTCACFIEFGFVMSEYLTPSQWDLFNRENKISWESGYCYICLLVMIHNKHSENSSQTTARHCPTIPLPFYHIVDVKGEYAHAYTIKTRPTGYETLYTDPSTPRCQVARATAESTHGLTLNVRTFCSSQFTLKNKGSGKRPLRCLREKKVVRFQELEQTFDAPKRVDPFTSTTIKHTYVPSTVSILTFYFSKENGDHNIGRKRLRRHGAVNKVKLNASMLPYLWCRLDAFPWPLIFCEDLRLTVDKLPEILNVARIDVDRLLRMKRTDDFYVPLPEDKDFAKILIDDYDHIRFYVAMKLRYHVLLTLKRVYPNSKNTIRDITVITRLEKLIEWNENYYKYMHTHNHPPPRTVHARTDEEVDLEQISDISKIPIPYHQYASDFQMFKMQRRFNQRRTPRQIIKDSLALDDPMRVYFAKFDRLYAKMEEHFSETHCYFLNDTKMKFVYLRNRIHNVFVQRGYSIYVAALIRVNIAYRLHMQTKKQVEQLRKDVQEENSDRLRYLRLLHQLKAIREYRYHLRLFAFTHLDLIQRFYDRRAFTNASLFTRVLHPNPNYSCNHYKEVRPYDTRMFYEGMLPDFSAWIDVVPFPVATIKDSLILESCKQPLIRIFSLLMQRTLGSRLTIEQHLKLCDENSSYMRMVSMVLEVSLLGAYKHSDYCPRFDQCVDLHRLFYRSHNTQHFRDWQLAHSELVLLAMREFVVFQVKLCYPYQQYLLRVHPWWFHHCRQIEATANVVRLACAQGFRLFEAQKAIVGVLKSNLESLHYAPKELIKIFKLRYTGLFQEVSSTFSRYQSDPDYLYHLCTGLSVVNAALANYNTRRIKLSRPFVKTIELFVQRLPRHTPLNVEWLLTFNWGAKEEHGESVNICSTTIELLRCALCFIKRQQYRWLEDALFLIHRRDYEIVDAFFFNLLTHYSIDVHPLNTEVAEQQARAVARRNRTDMVSSVSPYIGSMIFAHCCGEIKAYVAQEVTSHTLGAEAVGINVALGMPTCKKKDPFSIQKRNAKYAAQIYKDLTKALDDKKSDLKLQRVCQKIRENTIETRQKRYAAQSECVDTPLVNVPMIGYVVQITSPRILPYGTAPITNSYSVCTQCGANSLFSLRMVGPNGFICGECSIPHDKARNTPECVANLSLVRLHDPMHIFYVIDDRKDVGDFTYKMMNVCDHCYNLKTAKYRDFNNRIFFASDLEKCRFFSKNRMDFALAYTDHQNVNDLFDTGKSKYGIKVYAANKRKRLR